MARTPAGIRRTDLVEWLDLDEQIKALTARKAPLRDKALRAYQRLRDAGEIELPYTGVFGPVVLDFSEARTFDVEAFAALHPVTSFPDYWRPTVDRDAVPKELRDLHTTPVRRIGVRRAA